MLLQLHTFRNVETSLAYYKGQLLIIKLSLCFYHICFCFAFVTAVICPQLVSKPNMRIKPSNCEEPGLPYGTVCRYVVATI